MNKLTWRKLKPPEFSAVCWKMARQIVDFKKAIANWPEEPLKLAVFTREMMDAKITLATLRKCVAFLCGTAHRRGRTYRPTLLADTILLHSKTSHDAAKFAENQLKLKRPYEWSLIHCSTLSHRYYGYRDRHLETAMRYVTPRNTYFQHEISALEGTGVEYQKPRRKTRLHRWMISVQHGFVGRVKKFCALHGIELNGSGIIDVQITGADIDQDLKILRVRRGRGRSCVGEWLSVKEIKREQRKRKNQRGS